MGNTGTSPRRTRPVVRSSAPVGLLIIAVLTAAAVGGARAAGRSSVGASALGPGVLNHPVRVIPSVLVSIPADWPTDNHGAITCLTCHSEIPGIGAESNPRLRDLDGGYTSGADFCGRCHRIVDEGSARSVHWLALRRAHLGVDSASAVKGGRALDHYSQACLTCHDGVNASESANAARFGGMHADLGDKGKNHPVGVPYRSVDRPSYLSRLRPASLLPTEVALPGGDVSCISCHDLFGDQQHLLTVPIEGSQLCLTCHEMS